MSFKITKRTNTATMVIDFENADSCIEAINFIRENCPIAEQDREYSYNISANPWDNPERTIKTSRIKLIKMVRAYGLFVHENKTTGLRTAKEWVMKYEREWDTE